MGNVEVIIYNVAAFICALFVLEYGADKFVDHTAVVAKRIGVSPTVIALLTAGAEWEELAVVVLAITQKRSSLAVGNIVGSAIANILGAFSLGLIFSPSGTESIVFDRSAKLYCTVLFVVTCITSGLIASPAARIEWRALGAVFIVTFVVYLISIFQAIGKGALTAPERLESDDSDSSSDEESGLITNRAGHGTFDSDCHTVNANDAQVATTSHTLSTERRSSVSTSSTSGQDVAVLPNSRHGLGYHVAFLFIGMAALVLSAYVLSHAASSIVEATGISDVLFGVIILSFATTLPEKLVAVVSGSRGHVEVMVASTVGSNIFLLTLCMGILWAATGNEFNQGSVNMFEIASMLVSSAAMTLVVWLGTQSPRVVGVLMLAGYIGFIALDAARG